MTSHQPGGTGAREPRTRILGLDPGSHVLGYALLDSLGRGRFAYVECGRIRTRDGESMGARLLEIATGLREVLEEHRPAAVAMEDVFQHRNVRSALVLGQARGAALLVMAEAGLPVSSYAPATVKRAVSGSGRASKEQVQQVVTSLCRLTRPPPADAADALAIAICHCLFAAGASSQLLRPSTRGGGRP